MSWQQNYPQLNTHMKQINELLVMPRKKQFVSCNGLKNNLGVGIFLNKKLVRETGNKQLFLGLMCWIFKSRIYVFMENWIISIFTDNF